MYPASSRLRVYATIAACSIVMRDFIMAAAAVTATQGCNEENGFIHKQSLNTSKKRKSPGENSRDSDSELTFWEFVYIALFTRYSLKKRVGGFFIWSKRD
eukprot:jgi/Bigna1/135353/aug1.29_g10061